MKHQKFTWLLLCGLWLMAPVVLSACDEESSNGDKDTIDDMATPDGDNDMTTPDADMTQPDADMAQPDSDADMTTPGQCANVGDTCDPSVAQTGDWVCNAGVCTTACDSFDDCPEGSFCDLDGGVCVESECDGFWTATGCEAAAPKCIPAGRSAYVCVANGVGADGDACALDEDCGDGLLCLSEVCSAPTCDPIDSDPGCEGSQECDGLTVDGYPTDIGFCYQPCDAFVDGECPTGEWCFPNERNSATGTIDGVCIESAGGTALAGEACGTAGPGCVDEAICLLETDTTGTCRNVCDPQSATSGVGGCGDGELCSGLTSGGEPLDWGACFEACTPYVPNDESGCGANEWCFPDQTQPGVGQCTANGNGTQQEADLCGDETMVCADGLFCLGFSETEAYCVRPCDPEAGAEDVGGCGTNNSCGGLQSGGEALAFGFCQEGCVYEHGGARVECDLWGTCVPGELFGSETDVCSSGVPTPELNEYDDCAAAGLGEFDFCGTNKICVVIEQLGGSDLLCYEVCATGEGAFNTDNHPDCTRSTAVCTMTFNTPDFGICGADN